MTISTKVGRLIEPRPDGDTDVFVGVEPAEVVFDFSAEGVHRSLDASLERLGLDRVDVVFVHDPDDHADQAIAEAYPALERWRDEGVVGAIGVGMNQNAVPLRFVRETDIDVVLLAGRWSVLDQSGLAELLPACTAAGVSVVVGGVFNSGVLADPHGRPHYNYAAAPADVVTRALQLEAACHAAGVDLLRAALAFPWLHPAVARSSSARAAWPSSRRTWKLRGHRCPKDCGRGCSTPGCSTRRSARSAGRRNRGVGRFDGVAEDRTGISGDVGRHLDDDARLTLDEHDAAFDLIDQLRLDAVGAQLRLRHLGLSGRAERRHGDGLGVVKRCLLGHRRSV